MSYEVSSYSNCSSIGNNNIKTNPCIEDLNILDLQYDNLSRKTDKSCLSHALFLPRCPIDCISVPSGHEDPEEPSRPAVAPVETLGVDGQGDSGSSSNGMSEEEASEAVGEVSRVTTEYSQAVERMVVSFEVIEEDSDENEGEEEGQGDKRGDANVLVRLGGGVKPQTRRDDPCV